MLAPIPIRLPWPNDFPDVIVHTDLRSRDTHPGYAVAKAGDADAAITLASDLLDMAAIELLRQTIGVLPALLLPVIADETTGFNGRVRQGGVISAVAVGHRQAALAVMCRG